MIPSSFSVIISFFSGAQQVQFADSFSIAEDLESETAGKAESFWFRF